MERLGEALKKWFVLACLSVLGIVALAGCGMRTKLDKGEGDTKVVLNEVAHSIFYAPMYVAIEEGYFAEEGIDLTLETGFGADKTMTAVLSGDADIGFMGSDPSYIKVQLTERQKNQVIER